MNLYEDIKNRKAKIAVIGLGYVGMPLAVAFANKAEVIGFDINKKKIDSYRNGIDVTNEVGNEVLKETSVFFTNDQNELRNCKFHIVAVPNDPVPPVISKVLSLNILALQTNQGVF